MKKCIVGYVLCLLEKVSRIHSPIIKLCHDQFKIVPKIIEKEKPQNKRNIMIMDYEKMRV